MIWGAVFLVSLSALAFEVLLTRLFSITQWNHLSFMVISLALFGFAASGTFLNLITARDHDRTRRLCADAALKHFLALFSLTTLSAFVVLQRLPLDYFRLPLEPVQAFYLLVAYLALALPFFMAGLIVAVAYAALSDQSGRVYFATMLGSACGALAVMPGLPLLDETRLVVLVALLPLVLLPFRPSDRRPTGVDPSARLMSSPPKDWIGPAGTIGLLAATAITAFWAWHSPLAPSPYKALSQQLRFPGTRIIDTRHDIRGRVDLLDSPYIRFAPGLSLRYTTPLPSQMALYRDGDDPMVLYSFENRHSLDFAAHSLPYLGYHLHGKPRRVLILAQGGGSAMACALASGASQITVVTPHPQMAKVLSHHYRNPVTAAGPRAYLAGTGQRFDVIHLDDWGLSLPGSAALRQSYSFTIEALQAYWDHLRPGGIVILARKLILPPSDAIRIWATAYEALRGRGVSAPGHHLLMMRNWDLYSLVISAAPLTGNAAVAAFAREHNFDLLFHEGGEAALVNRFNRYDQPFHAREITRLAEAYDNGRAGGYFDAYPLDVRPQSDQRPFPYRILKWSRIQSLYQAMGNRLYVLVLSGEVVVLVVLIEALVAAALLLALPLGVTRRAGTRLRAAAAVYFLGVGAGFMLLEIYYIKQLMVLFEDPVVTFTVVVAGILIFSGLGGLYAQRCSVMAHRVCLALLCGAIGATALIPGRFWLFLAALSGPWRYGGALLTLLPTGWLMGIPFAVGMRRYVTHPAQSASAWALNGCTSVVAAIAAAQIALTLGTPALLVGAALAYLLALAAAARSPARLRSGTRP
jgi:hypothetical protein